VRYTNRKAGLLGSTKFGSAGETKNPDASHRNPLFDLG
jgi:hypothetical protein